MNSVSAQSQLRLAVDVERPTDGWPAIGRGSAAYVAAWLVGLATKPVGVTSADSDAVIASDYVDHRWASFVQVLLVHAVAAVALVVFAVGFARLVESTGRARVALWWRRTATVVALASLVQAAIGSVMIATAGSAEPSTTAGLLSGVERLDALKLVGLAVLCGVGVLLAHQRVLAGWTGYAAAAAAVCLLGGAIALAGVVSALAPMAVPALILLLVWVGGVSVTTRPKAA